MKFFSTQHSSGMAIEHHMRIEYAELMTRQSERLIERFTDYVARYCAKKYIKEHSAALKQAAVQEMVSIRVRKALRIALQEK